MKQAALSIRVVCFCVGLSLVSMNVGVAGDAATIAFFPNGEGCTGFLRRVSEGLQTRPTLAPAQRVVQGHLDVLRDPTHGRVVNLRTLSQDLTAELGLDGVRALAVLFHRTLVKAAGGGKNVFEQDNLAHVALHFRDLEGAQDLNAFFASPGELAARDVALLNAAIHDVGKVGEKMGLVSPQAVGVFNQATAGETSVFLKRVVLGHDEISLEVIQNIIREYGEASHWSEEKIARVTRLLQSASARHNAGYGNLSNDSTRKTFHWWQSNFPRLARILRKVGLSVADEYPAVSGGWVPVLLAMVDRGTSLHPSFVEKVAGATGVIWSADAISNFIESNARSVREEVEAIGVELQKHTNPGRHLADFSLMKKYMSDADGAEELGTLLRKANNWSSPFAGRPEVPEIERSSYLYYPRASGWLRLTAAGVLERHSVESNSWVAQSVKPEHNGKPFLILMREVIGYAPIDTSAPRF